MTMVAALQRRIPLVPLAAMALAASAYAQTDFVGDWDQAGGGIFGFQEEFLDRGGGPDLGDYVGLPINDSLRYKASLYSPSWLTVPEHTCLPHPATYAYRSPGGLSVVKEYDPVTQKLTAYRLYGTYGLARTIFMDGRAHPPANARHTYEGFSTGRWEGNKLVVETSHLKAGFLRRNGIAHSDRAQMTEYFLRHDDYLTVVTAVTAKASAPATCSSSARRPTRSRCHPAPCRASCRAPTTISTCSRSGTTFRSRRRSAAAPRCIRNSRRVFASCTTARACRRSRRPRRAPCRRRRSMPASAPCPSRARCG
jgi:hypothetical protein